MQFSHVCLLSKKLVGLIRKLGWRLKQDTQGKTKKSQFVAMLSIKLVGGTTSFSLKKNNIFYDKIVMKINSFI